jgi:hypothetical protein
MTPEPLGQLIARTRYLLLDFDGPICDIFAGLPATTVADRLRKLITGQGITLPEHITSSPDPIEVFTYSATIGPELAAQVENEMAEQELAAVATAKPTPYVHDVIASARESGRPAALVATAVDIRRAGHTSPLPPALIEQVHEQYLDDPEHARTPREPLPEAWAWTTRQRTTAALLHSTMDGRVEVFDYFVDAIQRRALPGSHVPEPVVRAAMDMGDPADVDALAATAYAQGRYFVAEHGYRRAWQAAVSNPGLGAEHPDTLTSRGSLALVLGDLGRLEEAEAEHRAVLETLVRVLGAEHPNTLASRGNLATVLRELGRPQEAETG